MGATAQRRQHFTSFLGLARKHARGSSRIPLSSRRHQNSASFNAARLSTAYRPAGLWKLRKITGDADQFTEVLAILPVIDIDKLRH